MVKALAVVFANFFGTDRWEFATFVSHGHRKCAYERVDWVLMFRLGQVWQVIIAECHFQLGASTGIVSAPWAAIMIDDYFGQGVLGVSSLRLLLLQLARLAQCTCTNSFMGWVEWNSIWCADQVVTASCSFGILLYWCDEE